MITESLVLPKVNSSIYQAISKFRSNYKGKAQRSRGNILAGYDILENAIKTEVFLL